MNFPPIYLEANWLFTAFIATPPPLHCQPLRAPGGGGRQVARTPIEPAPAPLATNDPLPPPPIPRNLCEW